jgi:RNA polymerase sigma factor (sigma-70 family)
MPMSATQIDLLLRHEGYVRALARRLVFDEDLARDVEQETWLAALQNAPREGSAPRAWLAQIVRSFAFKAFRSRARRSEYESQLEPRDVAATDPAVLLEREDARRSLIEAVAALDEPWRSTLILHFFDELSAVEVAHRLGVPVKTVYERIQRGLVLLREQMERMHRGSRDAWSLAMVRLFKFAPPSNGAIAGAAVKALIQGALVMSAVQKVVVSGAALVALVAALWVWSDSRGAEPSTASAARAKSNDVPQLPANAANEALDERRVETNSAPHAPAATRASTANQERFGSLLLRVVWAEDKSPAPGVWMKLHQESADDVYRDTLDVCTDEHGVALVERAFAGSIKVNFACGTQAFAQVVGGARAEATLEIPSGVDVEGKVLDIDGHPFGGADIYLHAWGASYEGFVVAKSHEDGSFRIRAIAPLTGSSVSARANDRTPTTQPLIFGKVGELVRVHLQFANSGGEVAGRVSSASGQPIANADVLVGTEGPVEQLNLPDGSVGQSPASQRVRSNAAGEFRIQGVAVGRQQLHVRVAGFAPWHGEVEVSERRTTALDVQLATGASLTGIVRNQAGEPLADVEVWANATFGFASTMRRTKSDGAFSMSNLPVGEFDVSADHELLGHAEVKLIGLEGGELRWDPVLSHGLVLHGHIVAPGRELSGWSVIAEVLPATLESWVDRVSTDERGHFEITNCPNEPLHLRLYTPGATSIIVASLDNVRAGDAEIALVPDPALEPSVYLRGRILEVDGTPLGGAMFCPRFAKIANQRMLTADAETGRFEVGPYPPGEWWICAISRSGAMSPSPKHTLVAGETFDFGDVQVMRGVVVAVNVSCACGEPGTNTSAWLRDDSDWTYSLTFEGTEARSPLVAPGHYVLTVERDGCAKLEREIVLRDGEQPRIDVELRAP